MVSTQHGFGLFFLDTGAAERKGEFLATAHGQDRVEQTSRGKNVHRGDTKIQPQGLVDGVRDDLRMTDGVRAVLVHPRVKGRQIHVAYFLALPSHSMQGHRPCWPPKEGLAGFQGWCEIERVRKLRHSRFVFDQTVPLTLLHFDDCVTLSKRLDRVA